MESQGEIREGFLEEITFDLDIDKQIDYERWK